HHGLRWPGHVVLSSGWIWMLESLDPDPDDEQSTPRVDPPRLHTFHPAKARYKVLLGGVLRV
ncbi:MAG: hypothetical protein E7L40_08435, partial [Corynebacterium kroppenstedtii]|nr:hypothetical protein [Corynebacterium kroppenstedtii]